MVGGVRPGASLADVLFQPLFTFEMVGRGVTEDVLPVPVKLGGDVGGIGEEGAVLRLDGGDAVGAPWLEFPDTFLDLPAAMLDDSFVFGVAVALDGLKFLEGGETEEVGGM